jgi:serine/threonine protein kinase
MQTLCHNMMGLHLRTESSSECSSSSSAEGVKVKAPGPSEVKEEDFEKQRFLGQGSYSTVVLAQHKASGQLFALKEVSRQIVRAHNMGEQIRNEINVHRKIRHPNIVRLYTYFQTKRDMVLVMQYCPEGNLFQKLSASPEKRFDEKCAARFTRHICRALKYLHEQNVAHRDLKLENVLLDRGNAIVADLGWSRQMEDKSTRRTVCGTLDYLSPEMLTGQPHTCATDVWSLGVMIYEMLSGVAPFFRASHQNTMSAICTEELVLPPGISDSAAALLQQVLQKDPSQRPPIAVVLAHPWVEQR